MIGSSSRKTARRDIRKCLLNLKVHCFLSFPFNIQALKACRSWANLCWRALFSLIPLSTSQQALFEARLRRHQRNHCHSPSYIYWWTWTLARTPSTFLPSTLTAASTHNVYNPPCLTPSTLHWAWKLTDNAGTSRFMFFYSFNKSFFHSQPLCVAGHLLFK